MEREDNGVVEGVADELAAPVEEKLIPVSRVNQIVAREKAKAMEKARQQMAEEQMHRQAELQPQSAGQSIPGMGGMPGVNVDQIKRDVYEQIMNERREAESKQQEAQHKAAIEEIAKTYHQKMGSGKDAYQDFDAVMGEFNAASFPKIVFLASQLDNTADIMYELAKNPMKLASIDYLADKNPDEAQKALKSLGSSIAQNRQALAQGTATQAPLSRMKSSAAAGIDSGEMSLKDFKKAPWLRG